MPETTDFIADDYELVRGDGWRRDSSPTVIVFRDAAGHEVRVQLSADLVSGLEMDL